ncbi:hypothetical protein SCAR479_10455 [Seiridium cardinale]|uniref:Fe2OG dioxygenase domain-containing protein n=1 Tax=Seiridium cardinale TaxID=138064 RepID=A0ABR2XGZ3_9PEZI
MIACLDLSSFTSGTATKQGIFCSQLIEALGRHGFVKLTNHGLSEADIKEVFCWNEKLFGLPPDVKAKAAHPAQPNPHRGLSHVGQEKLSSVSDYEKGNRDARKVITDIKESFDQGSALDTLYPNIWVPEEHLIGFRAFMEGFYVKCHSVHMQILKALAAGLGRDAEFFCTLCDQNTSELRLNHYPAVSSSTLIAGCNRISPHTDFGTVTLLFQDSVGGLEVEDLSQGGAFIPVSAVSSMEMILNVGDCLQRWTNDKLRSANHRVSLPQHLDTSGVTRIRDRYSIAYFGKPNRDVLVDTLDEFTAGAGKKYCEGMSAWEYNQAKLSRTY